MDEEGTSMDAYITNMYKVVRSMFFDEFSISSRFAKQHSKHLLLAQQLNEKLLTMTKLISRSEKVLSFFNDCNFIDLLIIN